MNTALMSAQSNLSLEEAMGDPALWGRLVESAVGASLLGAIQGRSMELWYWASGRAEVDFVLARGRAVAAIEVKSGRRGPGLSPPGPEVFSKEFEVKRNILVGSGGIPLEEFLLTDPHEWVR